MPWDNRRGSNMGYAFVNFLESEQAKKVSMLLNGQPWRLVSCSKEIKILPAHLQGIAVNLAHYFGSTVVEAGQLHSPIVLHKGQRIDFQTAVQMYCPPDFLQEYLQTMKGDKATAALADNFDDAGLGPEEQRKSHHSHSDDSPRNSMHMDTFDTDISDALDTFDAMQAQHQWRPDGDGIGRDPRSWNPAALDPDSAGSIPWVPLPSFASKARRKEQSDGDLSVPRVREYDVPGARPQRHQQPGVHVPSAPPGLHSRATNEHGPDKTLRDVLGSPAYIEAWRRTTQQLELLLQRTGGTFVLPL
jgi:hypothetical protein